MATVTRPDYELLTERAGLVERPDRGILVLTGADAGEFLQGQLTNDVEALAPGEGCYALLLTHKGKLRADMRVLRGEDWFLLDTESIGHGPVLRTIETYSLGREVTWRDETEARAILSLIGPESRAALDAEPPAVEHAFVEGRHGLYVSTDLGVDVLYAASEEATVRAALGLEEVSEEAAECLRIERGRPRHGVDMDEVIPEEAGLNERAVSFSKGCYVGQETVARLHYKGRPNRHLRGLRLAAPAKQGESVLLGDREVGVIGSTCASPTHGWIALAILRREASPGEDVAVGEGRVSAEVVELPF
jgi:folate-binding protein YgfZ